MFEKKPLVLASVILLTLVGAPVAASAAPPIPIFQDDEDSYQEDSDHDGDNDSVAHDERHEIIPPVITVPGWNRNHNHPPKAENPITGSQSLSGIDIADSDFVVVASNDPESDVPLEIVNPNESEPINVKLIRASAKNPADRFMESAYLGMGVLGVATLGLGATALIRAVRVRRSGKSDYFYDNK